MIFGVHSTTRCMFLGFRVLPKAPFKLVMSVAEKNWHAIDKVFTSLC